MEIKDMLSDGTKAYVVTSIDCRGIKSRKHRWLWKSLTCRPDGRNRVEYICGDCSARAAFEQ